MAALLSIGELARRTGLSVSAAGVFVKLNKCAVKRPRDPRGDDFGTARR